MKERRGTTRYNFGAIAEVIDLGSRRKLLAITRDLSLSGCFVKTTTPFAEGTTVWARITYSGEFAAIGKVTSDVTSAGMGIVFVEITPSDQAVIENWLGYSGTTGESSPLEPMRGQRLTRNIPVTVSGETSAGIFSEETETRSITDRGALLTLAAPVSPGQVVRLKNRLTRTEQRCRVLFVDPTPGDQPKLLGVELLEPEQDFWGIKPKS
jgi:hypothetical protein